MTDIIEINLSHTTLLAHEESTVWAELLVTAPDAGGTERAPVDIALVIDCSGSMGRGPGSPLDYAIQAAQYVLSQLDSRDRACIVGYGDRASLIHPLSHDHAAGIEASKRLGFLGFTNISAGLECAAEALGAVEAPAGRIFLLSDGQANRGVADDAGIAQVAAQLKEQYSLSISTFGVGASFNEDLMEGLAVAGGGGYHFIENPAAIEGVFAEELAEVFQVALHEVKLTWIPTAGVTIGERLGVDSEAGSAYLGNLPANAQRRVMLELKVDGLVRAKSLLDVNLTASLPDGLDMSNTLSATVELTGNEDRVVEGINAEVMARVVELQSAKVQAAAAVAAAAGNYDLARQTISRERSRMMNYTMANSESVQLLSKSMADLDETAVELSQRNPLAAKRMKRRSYLTRNIKNG